MVNFRDRRMSCFIKRSSKGWLRLSKKVARWAILWGCSQLLFLFTFLLKYAIIRMYMFSVNDCSDYWAGLSS